MASNQKDVVDPYQQITDGQNRRLKLTTDSPFTPTYVQQALTLSSDPAGVYESRVKDRHVPLENPARESRARKERVAKQARKQAEKDHKKLRPLGRNAAEHKGLWKLEKHATRFELFLPLHQLWMGYMSELLGLGVLDAASSSHEGKMPSASSMHAKLVKADFNGALLTVRQSRNPCLVGLSGIVLHETENAFKLITRKNQFKLIPKQNSVFALAVPLYSTLSPSATERDPAQTHIPEDSKTLSTVLDKPYIEFDLYGNQFCFRSADRSNRKFKAKETIEL
ncbi:RNase P subunit p29-like protein [Boletus coccyginus]|nr:RNase P subunit p29-like protein [Boletus coccyginus]